MSEIEKVVLNYVEEDDWSRPVYEVGHTGTYVKDIELGKYEEPSLYWSCPKNERDGEPDYPFKMKEGVKLVINGPHSERREAQRSESSSRMRNTSCSRKSSSCAAASGTSCYSGRSDRDTESRAVLRPAPHPAVKLPKLRYGQRERSDWATGRIFLCKSQKIQKKCLTILRYRSII